MDIKIECLPCKELAPVYGFKITIKARGSDKGELERLLAKLKNLIEHENKNGPLQIVKGEK